MNGSGLQQERPNATMAMPLYTSHKQVRALKIAEIEILSATQGEGPEEPAAILTPVNRNYAPFSVSKAYYEKHKPQVFGYFVVYADGYQSWSPAGPFEDGYTLDDGTNSGMAAQGIPAQQRADEETIMPVLPIFGYRQLNESGQNGSTIVARVFSETLRALGRVCPPGREFSIARTKLEEACMFAKKAISLDPRCQVGDRTDDSELRHGPAMFGGGSIGSGGGVTL